MARNTYALEVRDAIVSAARQSRAAGKSWDEALPAAQAAGYVGSAQALYQLMLRIDRQAEPEKGREAPPASEPQEGPVIVTPPASAAGFEYKRLALATQASPDAELSRIGAEGWQLVAATPVSTVLLAEGAQVTRIQYVFKRGVAPVSLQSDRAPGSNGSDTEPTAQKSPN